MRKSFNPNWKKWIPRKGDKVISKNGVTDIVKSAPGMSEYDSYNFREAEAGMLLEEAIWVFRKDWKPVSSRNSPTFSDTEELIKYL